MNKVIYVKKNEARQLNLEKFPNAGPNPNIAGMRKIYGANAFLIKSGSYLYNVDQNTYTRAAYGSY